MIEANKDQTRINHAVEDLQNLGYSVIKNAIDADYIKEANHRMPHVQEQIIRDVGKEKLERAGEVGVLRLMMKYDTFFLKFLELPILHDIINQTISDTAILHLQNGFINPPMNTNISNIFQYKFHRDFPRVLNGYIASINIFISISEFTKDNGATIVIPGSHQKDTYPSNSYMQKNSISVECPPGSLIIFDSTLIHASGKNITNKNRLGLNHQFTRSFIKQQIDYVRAMGAEVIEKQTPRTQQLLGYYTRVVTSLDEYYKPESERLYRKGQG